MVRLVFRPYTQIRRSICTSEPLRASTRVSSGFTLFRHSSPSFGSQRVRSSAASSTLRSRRAGSAPRRLSPPRILPRTTNAVLCFHCASGFRTCPTTRAHVRLLGPCFKTGRTGYRPIRHRRRVDRKTPARRTIAVRGHWRQSPQFERPPENEARGRPRGSSSVRRQANAHRAYNTATEVEVTLPGSF